MIIFSLDLRCGCDAEVDPAEPNLWMSLLHPYLSCAPEVEYPGLDLRSRSSIYNRIAPGISHDVLPMKDLVHRVP